MKTLCILSLFCLIIPVTAQDTFTLLWSTLDGGGGRSPVTAEFMLEGSSVGQFEAGDAAAGPGEFAITGGFWSFEYEPPPDLNLTLQLDGATVTLTWDVPQAAVVLESSEDLDLWAPVDPQPAAPVFQEPEGARRFYRLVPGP